MLAAGGGCGTSKEEEKPSSRASYAPAACPTPNVPGSPEANLGPEFTCGYLTVPENRTKPDGRTIRIAVARLKATSSQPQPDPIVWLAGGPGASATALAPLIAQVKPSLNADRDFIFVNQRGTLHTDPSLTCPEIDTFAHDAVSWVATDPATVRKNDEATKTCRTRLAKAGIDLSAYNSTENAADIADLRTALGIKEWNVYGVSYGTDLALQVARNHPQGIRSMVLASILPPQASVMEDPWPNAASGYQVLFDACAAQPACNSAYPNLRTEFMTTVQQLDQKPLTVNVPATENQPATTVVIDGYRLADLLVGTAINPGTFEDIPAIVHALAAGDGLPAAKAILGIAPSASEIGLVGYGLQFGVFCREHAASAFTNRQKAHAMAKAALPDFPDRVLSLLPQVPYLFSVCEIWDVGQADASVRSPVHSDIPTLLMVGSLDGVTPPRWAEMAARSLSKSQTLVFPGLGHRVIGASECARITMISFLNQPTGGYDTSCVANVTVPPFTIK
ncbi:alpha/beta fold hydrolase [Arthrobacter cavernae]|uniref:Alpha/beta fold hydrolase n=1 Tax=Arthrobacter cavernae TaxID=2817681 RepID=A0A939HFB0_9MICC|nr:alpha/beta fold hydrolase [Arthrobacter cavernae]MBO1269814.1 alpha/beta fold hydrolase [Arthrobacter cavernae]